MDVAGLGVESQDALVEAYRAAESIAKKARIARALAHVGDEHVVSLLTNALTREYVGRELTQEEAQNLGGIAPSLGYLARRYDSAFNFLMQGIDPAFWSRQSGLPFSGGFAGDCLRGLGLSARQEVPTIFGTVRDKSTPEAARELSGSLVTALFWYRMQQQHGDAWDNGQVCRTGEDEMRLFLEWGQTAEGRDWRRWSQGAQGIEDRTLKPPRARP